MGMYYLGSLNHLKSGFREQHMFKSPLFKVQLHMFAALNRHRIGSFWSIVLRRQK